MPDEHLMMRCLDLAREAHSKGEAPVGSVIARGDRIIAEGRERTKELLDHSAHAELQAIQAACRVLSTQDLSGFAIYSNVEPCVLCVYVIRRAGLARVVFGVSAGQVGGFTSQYAFAFGCLSSRLATSSRDRAGSAARRLREPHERVFEAICRMLSHISSHQLRSRIDEGKSIP
jgi:tRNA(adenine34) deaminase